MSNLLVTGGTGFVEPMKILLLGRRGQVGWELQRALAPLGDLTVLGRERGNGLSLDLENPDDLGRVVRRFEPRIIVNAAAYTDVERAETEPDRAERINAEAPRILAAEAARLGALLVHYSTDYVFDGSGTTPWREDDTPAPLNVYGATKWRGEQVIRDSGCRYLIFRTQWVYAARGENFIRKILRLAAERDTLEVVDDQHGAPTGAELIADVTAHALRLATARDGPSGTYHLAARGETTWHAYARFIVEEARRAGRPVRVSDAGIVPVATEAFPTRARRPRNSRLSVDRLEQTFGLRLPDWRLGVARALAESTGK
jgi:dTDP-4-dehydrorhamnose reductase